MAFVFKYITYHILYVLISLKLFSIFILLLLVFTMLIATITLIERKVMSLTQRRVGPNYIGYKGRFQFIADALKLIAKHIAIVSKVNRFLFIIVPMILLVCVYLFWANLIWAPNLAILELEYNLLFMGVLSSFFSYFLVLVGYNSNNKYAIIASSRVLIMSFTLEIFLTFFFVLLAFVNSSFTIMNLSTSVSWIYRASIFTPIYPLLLITLLLETNRIPFDLAEAESELIAGYTTEYGGFFFVLFYLGEYFHLFCFCTFYSLVLLTNFIIMLTLITLYIYLFNKAFLVSFFYINYFELIFLLIFLFLNYSLITNPSYRYKLTYFVLSIFCIALAGFYLSFDGFMFLLLITELTLIMLFLIIFISSSFDLENVFVSKIGLLFFFFLNFFFFFVYYAVYPNNFYYIYNSVYIYATSLFAKDFLVLYMFAIYLNMYVVIYISAILGLFSIFFICLFYSFKHFLNEKTEKKNYSKTTYFLRQQNMLRQRNFKPHIKMFQK